ncbi:MAG: S1C family serine protease [Chloroflexota bacterium]
MKPFRSLSVILAIGILLGVAATFGLLLSQAGPVVAPTLAAPATAESTQAQTARALTQTATDATTKAQVFDENVIVGIYDRVSPAVVNITSNVLARSANQGEQEVPEGTGSGFIFDARGYVLTNNHVVSGAKSLDVTLADGTTLSGKVLGTDVASDLAVLKIDIPRSLLQSGKVTVAKLGDSDNLRAGQMAVAIGNPFGYDRTITVGIISGLNRELPTDANNRPIRGGIQTDAAINPGNSGGPLLNAAGEVVGINSSIESPVQGSVGIGFAVPINTAKRNLDTFIAGGQIQHPRVGILGYPISQRLAEQLGLPVQKGVYVVQVSANGPADKAGLKGAVAVNKQVPLDLPKGGDIITAIDGQEVVKIGQIAEYIEMRKRVGDTINLSVKHGNEDVTISLTLDAWPE